METRVKVVCAIVGFLGILSAALAVAGEATKVTNKLLFFHQHISRVHSLQRYHLQLKDVKVTDFGQCMYPRSPALVLGFVAALSLLVAQIIINAVAGCLCCKTRPPSSNSRWTNALICFILSWVTFVMAFLLLLGAAALNDRRYDENISYGNYCLVVKSGVFVGAGILSLTTVTLGLVYYITVESSKMMWAPPANPGIAMGVPQVPPQSTEPVFVHEDTYNRRQLV
ncbi:protein VASCULATURE COMPLEXITY AND CONNECTIVITY-like isoform X2 [Carex rostrata]